MAGLWGGRGVVAGAFCVLQFGLWGQFISCACALVDASLCFYSLPFPPFSCYGKYVVSIVVPLLSVWQCLVVAAHRVVMVTRRAQLNCFGLHHSFRHRPQAHLLLMSLMCLYSQYQCCIPGRGWSTPIYNLCRDVTLLKGMVFKRFGLG